MFDKLKGFLFGTQKRKTTTVLGGLLSLAMAYYGIDPDTVKAVIAVLTEALGQ